MFTCTSYFHQQQTKTSVDLKFTQRKTDHIRIVDNDLHCILGSITFPFSHDLFSYFSDLVCKVPAWSKHFNNVSNDQSVFIYRVKAFVAFDFDNRGFIPIFFFEHLKWYGFDLRVGNTVRSQHDILRQVMIFTVSAFKIF